MQSVRRTCRERGRDPATLRFSHTATCLVGPTWVEVEKRVLRLMNQELATGDPWLYMQSKHPNAISGPASVAIGQIAEFAKLGVSRLVLQLAVGDDAEVVEFIATSIMPEIAEW